MDPPHRGTIASVDESSVNGHGTRGLLDPLDAANFAGRSVLAPTRGKACGEHLAPRIIGYQKEAMSARALDRYAEGRYSHGQFQPRGLRG
jgi:hypothetical protein